MPAIFLTVPSGFPWLLPFAFGNGSTTNQGFIGLDSATFVPKTRALPANPSANYKSRRICVQVFRSNTPSLLGVEARCCCTTGLPLMDEKRGDEFDGAEADDFFGDGEEDQEELSQPSKTMAER